MNPTFHDHFSQIASRYVDFRPRYPAGLFDYLATLAPRDLPVWDCACGNGQASIDLAQRFQRVIATDASREQIASAMPHARVEYRVATAEASGLADRSIGLITVAQALHWFHFEHFFAEARRVLVPNGVVAAWAYGILEVEGRAINEPVQDFYTNTVGPYWPPERTLVEESYRGIPIPFPEIIPPAFRMEMHWTLDQLLGYLSTWSATNRFIQANGYSPLEPLAETLAREWGRREERRLVTFPLTVRIAGGVSRSS